MPESSTIDLIVVPQGAEQWAVQRGMYAVEALNNPYPTVLSIPMGPQRAFSHLKTLQARGQLPVTPGCNVLLIGLGGGLSPNYHIGDVVLAKEMSLVDGQGIVSSALTHYSLVQTLYTALEDGIGELHPYHIGIEMGITCDRVIVDPSEKQTLYHVHGASVVDMEGEPVIRFFQSLGANSAVLRVISDAQNTLVPDLNRAIDANGHLHPALMAWQCLKRPLAAIRLIQGGVVGLTQLSAVTRCCLASTTSIKL